MRLSVKTSQGGGMFGGGPSSEVTIEGQDYEAGQATVSVLSILAQNGIGGFPGGDGDDETVGTTADDEKSEPDEAPAAGWASTSTETESIHRLSNPGDVVRIIWPDGMSRLFIDCGTQWVSPAVVGLFEEPMSVEFNDYTLTVEKVAEQPERGVLLGSAS